MKHIAIVVAIIGLLLSGCFDNAKQKNGNFHIYTVDNKDGNITSKLIENSLKLNGFIIGENANIKEELHSLYGDDNFKIYNNISFYHKNMSLDIVKKHSDAGILIPMGIVLYQNLDSNSLHIVVSRAQMQAKIIGINPKELQNLETTILNIITTLFPTAKHSYSEDAKLQQKKLLTKYTLDLSGTEIEDIEDVKEELEEDFEEKFGKEGFAMPSYFDLTDDLGEDSPYDFYVTYALCKLDVLRVIAKLKPEAAVLGPCVTIIYKKKNEQKIVMAFASIHNWIGSANIEDKASIEALLDTQQVYEAILKDVTKN